MREVLGWLLCGLGGVCTLCVMALEAGQGVPRDSDQRSVFSDHRSVFDKEHEQMKNQQKSPYHGVLVVLGLAFTLLGLYLLGVFG